MNSSELRDIRRLELEVTPLPELHFENQRVTPARLEMRLSIEHNQLTHLELDLLLKTPSQVHAFQGFLSQFEPVEAIQALAYFPDLELHVIFEAKAALIDLLNQKNQIELTANDFLNGGQLAALADLDQFYVFKQYESVPVV